jgi:hypothetical protein
MAFGLPSDSWRQGDGPALRLFVDARCSMAQDVPGMEDTRTPQGGTVRAALLALRSVATP